jgi:signal transduction histidine kinase
MSSRPSLEASSTDAQPSALYLRPVLPAAAPADHRLHMLHRHGVKLETEMTTLRRRCEQAEEVLDQSQKMAAVGQLTSGIAHDFNNLLTSIDSGLRLVQAQISLGRVTEADRLLGLTFTSVAKASALTQRLLAFARRQPLNPEPVAVNQLVAGMKDLIRQAVGPTIDIVTTIAPEQWHTLCNTNQLETALLNLCINARDAMMRPSPAKAASETGKEPEGGQLTIKTWNTTIEDSGSSVRHEAVTPGDYIALSVADTGIGMPPDVAARACDPFFTTKPAGHGTGLGLSQALSFAEQAGGTVVIESEPGHGTTVTVLLPRYADSSAMPAAGNVPEENNGRGLCPPDAL